MPNPWHFGQKILTDLGDANFLANKIELHHLNSSLVKAQVKRG